MLLEIYNEQKKRREKPKKPKKYSFLLILFSFFSVVFGCSNLLILEEFNFFTFIVIIFTLLIYIINEYYKSYGVFKFVETNKYVYLFICIVCVFISLTSVYGVYQIMDTYSIQKKQITYKREIDSLYNKINSNYIDSLVKLNNQELYSTKKMSDSLKQQLSLKKQKIEEDIYKEIERYKTLEKQENINNSLSYMKKSKIKDIVLYFLISIVFIVESCIIALSYQSGVVYKQYLLDLEEYNKRNKELLESKIGRQFQEYIEAIKYIYSLYEVHDVFVRNKFTFIKNNKSEFIDLLESLKIISDDRNSKILVTEKEALEIIDKHFSKLL